MEDGLNSSRIDVELSDCTKNGVVAPIMANFPEGTVAVSNEEKLNNEVAKVNGENHKEDDDKIEDECSSESDALVIDESVPKQKPKRKQRVTKPKHSPKAKDCEVIPHSNPYFNESLFELSQLHQQSQESQNEKLFTSEVNSETNCKVHKNKRGKGKSKPKLREYAQYLGLQPTVQFRCSKCGRAGFESLSSLNEHIVQCNEVNNVQQTTTDNPCSGFKLTRKVFLCSACGTYYENWNLYMHMLEFHRRYICLYCLGMFSVLEDLCQHIQVKHNLEPGHKNSPDEFFSVYNEPCYLICCDCNKLFSEQDNFYYHNCIKSDTKNQKGKGKPVKQQITPENHVTGDSAEPDNILDKDNKEDSVEKRNSDNTVSMETVDVNQDLTLNNQKPDIKEEQDIEVAQLFSEMTENKSIENINENEDSNMTNSSDMKETSFEKSFEEELDHNMAEDMEKPEDKVDELEEPIETRKVPKLSLKLPKPGTYPEISNEDSNDSEKLTMEIDQVESENDAHSHDEFDENTCVKTEDKVEEEEDTEANKNTDNHIIVAGNDIAIIELELEQPLDKFDIRVLLQKCLKATATACIYCNHARKIAVNGKQLGLHAIAEHRYSAIVNSITAEELIPESFVQRIKESLNDLENVFFNLESGASDEAVTFSHLFECFQCRYSTTVHKELYLHNRKLHAKNLLLCIMCKSNFFSYSELICHLCPGVYVLDYDLQFRCCMCVNDDLPSAFRLMVHLRKRHHVCDVCLEMCHNQYRLSNHVWKHKLHHFCYRCCIAYRNKPDITRHLFWKHGTESVLCKKCLQKKWPHVYHFCVPPASFTCDECNLSFSKAVALKVHKRIHSDEKPHSCTFEECTEKFISKKLMMKHEFKHREPVEEPKVEPKEEEVKENEEKKEEEAAVEEKVEEKPKPKIDVYDLPALNLSESDSSDDSEDEAAKSKSTEEIKTNEISEETVTNSIDDNITSDILENNAHLNKNTQLEEDKQVPVIENIWDDFKNYQAHKDKMDQMMVDSNKSEEPPALDEPVERSLTIESALRDHDYCMDPERKVDTSLIEVKPDLTLTERVDHDYCSPKVSLNITNSEDDKKTEAQDAKSPKKRTNSSSSDSSSDSDSSSCSCGSNCSCSSSSGSSSSSSDSSESDSSTEEGRRRQTARRERRKERNTKNKGKDNESKVVDVVTTDQQTPVPKAETPILESDLETTESETDEEFYDKQPQKLAKKILEEKRNQLLAEVGSIPPNGGFIESTSRPPTPPSYVEEEQPKPKKKSKSKKRKKRKSERRDAESRSYQALETPNIPVSYYHQQHQQQYQPPTVAPITLSLSRNSPILTATATIASPKIVSQEPAAIARRDSNDSSLRASKRRRVPNKFYGYSSDEDDKEKPIPMHTPKWRKTETAITPRSPLLVPPITIKTVSSPRPPPTQLPPIEPISIRASSHPGEMRVHPRLPPIRLAPSRTSALTDKESGTDSNESDAESISPAKAPPNQPQLYCYCRCPYDEVSEMIGCDSNDCAIEWFHFECVGIMVPPKGQWFCPDCRKKKQMRREMLQT